MVTRTLMKTLALFFALAHSALAAPEFFVLDNGVGRGSWTPEQQARTLKELGYDGISYNYTTPEALAAWQAAFKAQGLKIHALYIGTAFDEAQPYDPRLPEAVRLLKGSDTVLWITIHQAKATGDHDAEAVKLVQQVADLARDNGLRVAIYGHVGFYVATAEDSARIAKLVARPNVGATLNLCHEFLGGHGDQLDASIAHAAPTAMLATINGVDVVGKKYILRLDQGDFDLAGYLKKLRAAGYHGPVGLQCYSVAGDVRENLAADIAAWRRIAGESDERSGSAPPQNVLTADEAAAGWQLLFDGKTLAGWHGFQQTVLPDHGWTVDNGYLKCLGQQGGDILTTRMFTDFEFTWEWRLSFRGNSGVKYFVDEKRTNGRGAIGHEYQMIDNDNYVDEPLNPNKLTGSWYDVMAPTKAMARPLGELNHSRIVVQGHKVEHWLNGELVVGYQTDSAASAAGIANSKFKDVVGYADNITTPLLLQDHNTVVWLRNLKLRELPAR